MPFTPFHFGPGAALKAGAPKHFSFTLFCYAQVVTDVEPGYHMLRGEFPLHGFFHTFPGATVMAVFCAVTGRFVCGWTLRTWHDLSTGNGSSQEIPWSMAFITAFIGTWSHVFLDGIMHRDVRPFAPFTDTNPFLGLIGVDALHNICLVLGIVGVLGLLLRRFVRSRPQ